MSREDPQFKLRMPAELRDLAEQAAKAAGRSLNAEIVTRLEASLIGAQASDEKLITAEKAKELALMAREGIPEEIRRRAVTAINKAVSIGHREAFADLRDLHLENGISDEDLDAMILPTVHELEKSGYTVKWEDIDHIWIVF